MEEFLEDEVSVETEISGKLLLEKNKNIKKEKNRLRKIFTNMPKTKKAIVEKLIDNAAFMAVTLDELKEHIKKNGVKETYMNGAAQFGYKESIESKTYNTMIKNYSNVIKQLIDLLPKEEKEVAGEDLLKFIANPNV